MPLSPAEYLAGCLFAALTAGPVLAAAVVVQRAWLRHLPVLAAVLAVAALATFGLIAAHLVPGSLGALSRESAAVAALLLLLVAWLAARRWSPPLPPADGAASGQVTGRAQGSVASSGLAFAAVGLVVCFAMATLLARGAAPPATGDATGFHLPGIASWIQAGSVWGVDQFLPGIPTAQYPHSGDLLLMGSMLPWENDAFIRLGGYVYLGILGLAIFAIATELGATRSSSAIFAALALAVPAVNEPATFKVMTDPPLLAMLGVGVLMLVRYHRSGLMPELLVAGLALGLAFGTKWYGVSAAVVVVAVWTAARWLARDGTSAMRTTAILGALIGAAGGFWFLRNWVESGNPIYPVRFQPFGINVLDAPAQDVDRFGFTVFDYLGSPDVLVNYVIPGWADRLGAPALLLLLAALVAIGVALRGLRATGGAGHSQGPVLACGLAALLLVAAYTVTPGTAFGLEGEPSLVSANSRYVTAAFVLAAPIGAWLTDRAGRWRRPIELVALLAIIQGLAASAHGLPPMRAALGVAVVGTAVATVLVLRRRGGLSLEAGRLRIASAGAALLVLFLGAGYFGQQRYNEGRYVGLDPTFDVVTSGDGRGGAIGVAGLWTTSGPAPTWPMFGSRLENEVTYVGRMDDATLRRFTDRDAFVAEVEGRPYDLLIIGTGTGASGVPDELKWARDAGYPELARSARFVMFAPGAGAATHPAKR